MRQDPNGGFKEMVQASRENERDVQESLVPILLRPRDVVAIQHRKNQEEVPECQGHWVGVR
ncbi:MAG: hypothetical protein ACLQPD_26930 [Desulfomonilaceae bacterium]